MQTKVFDIIDMLVIVLIFMFVTYLFAYSNGFKSGQIEAAKKGNQRYELHIDTTITYDSTWIERK